MEESQNLNVGGWYYIDRIAGATQEEIVATNSRIIVVRDCHGNLSTINPEKIIAQAPRPFFISDIATEGHASVALVVLLIVASFFRQQ